MFREGQRGAAVCYVIVCRERAAPNTPTTGRGRSSAFFAISPRVKNPSSLESLTSCQHDMGCRGGRDMGGALIAQCREIEPIQEMLAGPEQHWRDRHV